MKPVSASQSQEAEIVTEDFMLPSADPGIRIHVRNRRLAELSHYEPGNIVLFVHGATTPPEAGFDLKLDGISWMEWMAGQGNDVYFVSVRSYGRSTRPSAMDEPPLANPPLARLPEATKDVGTAVDFILERRRVQKISLLGHSWGTTIMAAYTANNNAKVHRLALFAPQWLRSSGRSPTDAGGELGAYRLITAAEVKQRREGGLAPGKQEELMPRHWFEAYMEAQFASDPQSGNHQPRAFRASNGVVQDGREYLNVGKPLYDPADIRVPVLIVIGELDADTPLYMAQTLFPLLVNAPIKRFVIIGEASHVLLTEKNRMQLFGEVGLYFMEGRK